MCFQDCHVRRENYSTRIHRVTNFEKFMNSQNRKNSLFHLKNHNSASFQYFYSNFESDTPQIPHFGKKIIVSCRIGKKVIFGLYLEE